MVLRFLCIAAVAAGDILHICPFGCTKLCEFIGVNFLPTTLALIVSKMTQFNWCVVIHPYASRKSNPIQSFTLQFDNATTAALRHSTIIVVHSCLVTA